MSVQLNSNELDLEILRYSYIINKNTGLYWFKRYTYSAFWSLVATPINLSITIFTALTTAQTTTGMLTNTISGTIGITTLILSIINTFFKPYNQLADNQALKDKWADSGVEFESIYGEIAHSDEDKRAKLAKLSDIWEKVCTLKKSDDNNYLIDIIFIIFRITCIKCKRKAGTNWLPDIKEEYKKEKKKKTGEIIQFNI